MRAGFIRTTSLCLGLFAAGCRPPSTPDAGSVGATAVDPCNELAARLCQTYGPSSEVCELVTERANRFTKERCQRKLDAFGDEVAALDRMQAARRTLASPRQLTGDKPTPALGANEPKVTVVEFSDFTCSDCGRASLMAHMVERLYGDQVRFVFRQFPRSTHPHAHLAAEASLAAHAQGKFWAYHDLLFANPHDLSRPALVRYAREAGLEPVAFETALNDGRYRDVVERDVALARDAFVTGPPALFIDGKQVPVPFSVTELSRLIDEALRAGPNGHEGRRPRETP